MAPGPINDHRAGFVAAHHGLAALMPTPIRSMLPVVSPLLATPPARCDYSKFIEWLKLPRFAHSNTATNWVDFFARALPQSKKLVVDRLVELIEFGAEPQHRELDLYFAWWELQFAEQEKRRGMPLLSPQPDDSKIVLKFDHIETLGKSPQVAAAIMRFRDRASTLKIDGWNQRSVMGLLGYAVGFSGPPQSTRHAALEACMILPDCYLPQSQREFWGSRGTLRRARAIARMINLFVSLAQNRTGGDWTRACDDWRADQRWVEAGWW